MCDCELTVTVHKNRGLSGGGGTPLYKPYSYVLPQRVGVFALFWSENRYRLCLLWSGIRYDFLKNYRIGVYEQIYCFSFK